MNKIWLLSPLIMTLSLFGQETDNTEIAKRSVFGQKQTKKSSETSCSSPEKNYRLQGDFWGVNTFVEYLLWQVQEQGAEFVATDSSFDLSYPNFLLLGRVRPAAFDWNSGVRAGYGYSFGRDVWQLLGQYTWYQTEGNASYSEPGALLDGSGDFLTSKYQTPLYYTASGQGTHRAIAETNFSYQMADLLLGSAWLATDQIQFNYFLGATGGYIREQLHLTYFAAATGPYTPVNTYIVNSWSFGGGGFRGGVDTNWHLGRGFGFFGKVSFAPILGQYTSYRRTTTDGVSGFFSEDDSHYQNSIYRGIMLLPTTQFLLGFDWCKTFMNCSISAVKLSLAGEFNYLGDLQQTFFTPVPQDGTGYTSALRDVGSVYMYGGTAHLGADF